MKKILSLICLSLVWVSFTRAPKPVDLFNGKNFRGWEGDTSRMWRIEKGALVGGSLQETVPQNDFLCTTRRYADFELHLQFKIIGTGFVNAGVQFRSERAKQPTHEMVGYQADLGAGYWGSLYDESRRDKVLAGPDSVLVNKILRPTAWNDYKIRCEGRRIRIWLNGRPTIDYTEPDTTLPQQGLIGLQIHGGGKAEASYRSISLRELPLHPGR